jgi:hypothetical protein
MNHRHRSSSQSQSSHAAALVPNTVLADRIRGVLATRRLTLYEVSQQTRARFPGNPRYHIPHNLYFQLRSAGLSPTLHQLFALSQLSSYRLADWLAVFGFGLDEIPRLQASLPRRRTTLLDTNLYDVRTNVSWFRERPRYTALPLVAPLSQLLQPTGPRRLSSLLAMNRDSFLYARIGWQDAFAFPDLLPGSIVRANPASVEGLLLQSNGQITRHLFLVEHSKGLCCCRLHLAAKTRITLTASQLPFAQVELQLGSEARVLGALDLEFRPLISQRQPAVPPCALPDVAPDLARLWKPASLRSRAGAQQPGALLRQARLRAGLSFRDASELSRRIATALHDSRYFTSHGSLSDYEATNTPPRHIHKIFTICILYSIGFAELRNAYGLTPDESGLALIPDEWLNLSETTAAEIHESHTVEPSVETGFLTTVLERLGDVPFFLRNSFESLSGLADVSLRDVFWVGGRSRPLRPSLAGALFVIVNHRRKNPVAFRRKQVWEQPLYLLTKRDGSYLAASCSLESDTLVVRPYSEGFVRPERFRNRVDAEVVGQIVTIVRSLLPSE